MSVKRPRIDISQIVITINDLNMDKPDESWILEDAGREKSEVERMTAMPCDILKNNNLPESKGEEHENVEMKRGFERSNKEDVKSATEENNQQKEESKGIRGIFGRKLEEKLEVKQHEINEEEDREETSGKRGIKRVRKIFENTTSDHGYVLEDREQTEETRVFGVVRERKVVNEGQEEISKRMERMKVLGMVKGKETENKREEGEVEEVERKMVLESVRGSERRAVERATEKGTGLGGKRYAREVDGSHSDVEDRNVVQEAGKVLYRIEVDIQNDNQQSQDSTGERQEQLDSDQHSSRGVSFPSSSVQEDSDDIENYKTRTAVSAVLALLRKKNSTSYRPASVRAINVRRGLEIFREGEENSKQIREIVCAASSNGKEKESNNYEGNYFVRDLIRRMRRMEQRQVELEDEVEEGRKYRNAINRLDEMEKKMNVIEETQVLITEKQTQIIDKQIEISELITKEAANNREFLDYKENVDGGEKVKRSITPPVRVQHSVQSVSVPSCSTSAAVDSDRKENAEDGSEQAFESSHSSSLEIDDLHYLYGASNMMSDEESPSDSVAGCGKSSGTSTDSSSHYLDESDLELAVRVPSMESRLEALEVYVKKKDDGSDESEVYQEVLNRLISIEDNQKRLEVDIKRGHQIVMEEMRSIMENMTRGHALQVAATQRYATRIANATREIPKHIPTDLDAEELTRSLLQASVSAAKSSLDSTAAAAAAREAAEAARFSAREHAALVRQSPGDGSASSVEKRVVVSLDEIEQIIMTHPAVKSARVFRHPDKHVGTNLFCVISLKDGARVSEPWLKLFASSHLPHAWVPNKFFIKHDLVGNEDRKSLAKDKKLRAISEVTGCSSKRTINLPTWRLSLRPRSKR